MTAPGPSRLQRLLGLLETDPQNLSLLADAASAALDEGDAATATGLIARYGEISPAPPEVVNLAGLAALAEGRYADAAGIFEGLLQASPGDPALRFNLAWCRSRLGGWAAVSELLDESVIAENARAATLKVQALHHLGELEDALAWGQGAAERYPEDQALMGALAIAALDAEELELAKAYAEKAEDSPHGLSTRGMLLLNDGRTEAAIALFARTLKTAPADGRALLGMGLGLLADDHPEEAAEWIDRGAEAFKTHLGSWVAAGWAHFVRGDYAASRARFETALAVDDAFAEVHGGLAVLDIAEGQIESARRRTELALRLDHECFAAALATMLLLAHDGDPARAQRIRDLALNAPAGPGGLTIAQAMATMGRRPR